MSYAVEHAEALADLQEAGARVSFVTSTQPVDNNGEPTGASVETTVGGYAIVDTTSGDLTAFQALSLVETSAKRLLFAPDRLGDEAPAGAWCVWNAQAYRVRGTTPAVELDGPNVMQYVHIVQ